MAPHAPRQLQFAGSGSDDDRPRRVRVLRKATENALTEDGFTAAMELALTPLVFGFLGYVLDRWLGLLPLFTLLFSLWAFSVVAWMTWRRYDETMTRLETELPARGLQRDAEGS